MKRIVFVTDTWSEKNLDGVITWLHNMKKQLETKDFRVTIIHPALFFNFPMPLHPEFKIAPFAKNKMEKILLEEKPDYIHIVTPGTLGFYALKICIQYSWSFTTFYHTRLPEYVYARMHAFDGLVYRYLRWFHNAGSLTKTGTHSIKEILEQKGFKNLVTIPLGIDLNVFRKNENATVPPELTKPIFTYVGRIAPEKNVEAFLCCKLPGSKLVVGDGPLRKGLESKYTSAYFVGHKNKKDLVDLLSISDVFVFPSKTDTFGLAIVEALACGLPVAAYDVPGPRDIITSSRDGFLGNNLEENAKKCLTLRQRDCVEKSRSFSWENSASLFISHLVPSGV